MVKIDTTDVPYRELNERIRRLAEDGERHIELLNVCGHKFIGDGLKGPVKIDVYGVPGNDLAAFMDGPEIEVHANGQDGIGNTMNAGRVVVHGHAGDVIGYAMRGGKIFVRGDVGYRVGIHMKSYGDRTPCIVIGGSACDFFGEYMAGGVMVLLGLGGDTRPVAGDSGAIASNGKPIAGDGCTIASDSRPFAGDSGAIASNGQPIAGDYVGTGMHGGVIYVRGDVEDRFLGREVRKGELDEADRAIVAGLVREYCDHFGCDRGEVMAKRFVKLTPKSHRPYGNLYAH